MTADPYCYPGTDVLINRDGIRDQHELDAFERTMTLQRMREGLPALSLTEAGYRGIHRHLFQDVYAWAGKYRTVNIAKSGSMFCLVPHIAREMRRRFAALAAERCLARLPPHRFADRAAEYLSDLNAVHPFREGNGRTLRAFLHLLGEHAGHWIDLRRIERAPWHEASVRSFRDADHEPMRRVICAALVPPPEDDA